MKTKTSFALGWKLLAFVLLTDVVVVSGFAVVKPTASPQVGRSVLAGALQTTSTTARRRQLPHEPSRTTTTSSSTRLCESMLEVKSPTSDEAARLGARDWPQQVKTGSWSERIDGGTVAVRYILSGTGSIAVTLYSDDDAATPKTEAPSVHKVVPGLLVEAMGPANIDWEVDDTPGEMIVLTPGYEQGSLLAAVAALFVVLCGALIGGVGQ